MHVVANRHLSNRMRIRSKTHSSRKLITFHFNKKNTQKENVSNGNGTFLHSCCIAVARDTEILLTLAFSKFKVARIFMWPRTKIKFYLLLVAWTNISGCIQVAAIFTIILKVVKLFLQNLFIALWLIVFQQKATQKRIHIDQSHLAVELIHVPG